MKVILFDIDGTLVKSEIKCSDGTSLAECFDSAAKKVFNIDSDITRINKKEYAGRTDTAILLALLESYGLSRTEVMGHMPELIAAYTESLKEKIKIADIHATKGAAEILESLRSKGYHMGLITGNVKETAKLKLEKVGLMGYFEFGGFGDMSEKRLDLATAAVKEAESLFKSTIPSHNIFYFGDTPNDISMGKASGFTTIILPTGTFSSEELMGYSPDYLVESLERSDDILGIIAGSRA